MRPQLPRMTTRKLSMVLGLARSRLVHPGCQYDEYSGILFIAILGLYLLGTILAITGIATIDWVEQTYSVSSFSFQLMVGLYKLKTTTGSTTTTTNANWCGNGENVKPTAYCHQVQAVRGLIITSVILGFVNLTAFTAARGRTPRLLGVLCLVSSSLCAIFLWSACGIWSQVKNGYCDDLQPLYTSYKCKLGPSLTEEAVAGVFFLVAALGILLGKTVKPSAPLLGPGLAV